MSARIPVAILGATGLVGQRLVAGLVDHPWFRVAELQASPRSAGRSYREAVDWCLPLPLPEEVGDNPVSLVSPEETRSPIVFSALGAELAHDVEEELAVRGKAVISNASAHRFTPDVPLLIPELNPEHAGLLAPQRRRRGGSGCIVTNPNCSTIGLALALGPVFRRFGIKRVSVVTLQALSGGGMSGVAAMSLADNVIPHIEGEAHKIETESRRILGQVVDDRVEDADFAVSARVHRVPVRDGHLLSISLETEQACDVEQLAEALASFRGQPQELSLPSAPSAPLHVLRELGRPQPLLDRDRDGGMAVSVGSIEPCPVLGLRYEALVHNAVRGAAGAALLNAEWLLATGHLEGIPGLQRPARGEVSS